MTPSHEQHPQPGGRDRHPGSGLRGITDNGYTQHLSPLAYKSKGVKSLSINVICSIQSAYALGSSSTTSIVVFKKRVSQLHIVEIK